MEAIGRGVPILRRVESAGEEQEEEEVGVEEVNSIQVRDSFWEFNF